MYLFDIDGVLMNLQRQPDREAIDLAAQLMVLHPTGFVTGREFASLSRMFLPELTAAMERHQCPADQMDIRAEYGSVHVLREGNIWTSIIDPAAIVTQSMMQKPRELAETIATLNDLLFHHQKQIIVTLSVAALPNDESERAAALKKLEGAKQDLEHLVRKFDGVELQQTTKALDLVPIGFDKGYGATQVLDRFPRPAHAHIFGDAEGDLALARPFAERGIPYTFWFVGDLTQLTGIDTSGLQLDLTYGGEFTRGTRHILSTLLHEEGPV